MLNADINLLGLREFEIWGNQERGKEKRVGGVSVSGAMKSGDGVESAGTRVRRLLIF